MSKSANKSLLDDLAQLKHDFALLKEFSTGINFRFKALRIFGRYIRKGRDATEWILSQLADAVEAGQVTEREFTQVAAADLLWRGRLSSTKTEIVLVAEISWLVAERDIERAVERAQILRKLGLQALPVVSGREWPEALLTLAHDLGVVYITNGRIEYPVWQNGLAKQQQAHAN